MPYYPFCLTYLFFYFIIHTYVTKVLISLKSGHIKNVESARISFPGQLKCISTNVPATKAVESFLKMTALTNVVDDRPEQTNVDAIAEIDEDVEESLSHQNHKDTHDLHTTRDVIEVFGLRYH